MSKKIIAAACGLLVSGVVCADDTKFYLGADAGYNKLGYYSSLKDAVSNQNASLKSKVPSVSVLGGARFHENFGAEVGYTFYKKAKFAAVNTDGSIRLGNIHVDVLGYMPVNCKVDLVGALGVGRARVKEVGDINKNGISSEKYNKLGVRVGAGVQYNIDCHFAARAMVKYQKMGAKNGLELVKKATSLNVGLIYNI